MNMQRTRTKSRNTKKKCGKLVHANMAFLTSREKIINFISLIDLEIFYYSTIIARARTLTI